MTVSIEGIRVYAFHGVFEREKEQGQDFFIDVKLEADDPVCDDLNATVDYGEVAQFAGQWTATHRFDLIESVAAGLADAILASFPAATSAEVTVHKPYAPVEREVRDLSVTAVRTRVVAYLGFGSNLGDRKTYLDAAIETLAERDDLKVEAVSSVYETEPYGVTDQPKFLNACASVTTALSPKELLEVCRSLERDAGRIRTRRWGERTLDVDLLMYGDQVIQTPELTVPHPGMHIRAFVLDPLAEIAPWAIHPVLKKPIAILREECNK